MGHYYNRTVCACVRVCVCAYARVCVGVYVTAKEKTVNFQQQILEKLTKGYNPKIRPVFNHTTPTIVTVMLTLKQLRRLVSSIVAKDPDMAICTCLRHHQTLSDV